MFRLPNYWAPLRGPTGNGGSGGGNPGQLPQPSHPVQPSLIKNNHNNCVAGFTAVGAVVGAGVGTAVGGTVGDGGGAVGGTLAAPGVGTIGGRVLGAEGGIAVGAPIGGAIGGTAGYLLGNVVCSSASQSGGGNGQNGSSKQYKKLSPAEERKLVDEGGAHQIKKDALGTSKAISQYDLYKDGSGNIYVKGKSGVGEPITTGLNIFNF